jgi:hypothetical protein
MMVLSKAVEVTNANIWMAVCGGLKGLQLGLPCCAGSRRLSSAPRVLQLPDNMLGLYQEAASRCQHAQHVATSEPAQGGTCSLSGLRTRAEEPA